MKCPVSLPHWLVRIALVFLSRRPLHCEQIFFSLPPRLLCTQCPTCLCADVREPRQHATGDQAQQFCRYLTAPLSPGVVGSGVSYSAAPGVGGARFRFAFGDLYWFHSSPCLLAFMWLVLIGRDLRWILCPISLHQLLGSSLVLWICVCNTHQLCLAVWGHGDRDAVLWKPFTNQKNQSWAQWMSALQTHRVSTQVAEHENQTSPALEACEVSSHGWVCNSEPGGW